MAAPMSKQQLIAEIQQEHAQWQALLSEIGLERMELPGVTGDWTMKDSIAHLTTWWRREIALVEAVLRGERPPDHPPQAHVQIINQWVYLTNRDRPLQDVMRDAEDACRHMETTLHRVPEDLLFDPTRLAWLDGRALGPSILDNFVKHLHEEHEPMIRAWLAQV
jgi:hypothetical protein